MWWQNGFRHADQVFNIQTSHLGLSFDYDDFELLNFGPIGNSPSQPEALTGDNRLIQSLPKSQLRCIIGSKGKGYQATNTPGNRGNCMLIESGRYYQRRWLEDIRLEKGAPEGEMYLEIAAWPDRVTFVLYFTPKNEIQDGFLVLELDLESVFSTLIGSGDFQALADTNREKGYVFVTDGCGAKLQCNSKDSVCTLRMEAGSWKAGEEKSAALIVYPVAGDCASRLDDIRQAETLPVRITARQSKPELSRINARYNRRYGAYEVELLNDDCEDSKQECNDRIERVELRLSNMSSKSRRARMRFLKDGKVFAITGISAMLCDESGYGLGIPVQLSKNWHNAGENRFCKNPWYRGSSIVTVPAKEVLKLNYTSVGPLWGGLPAASHAQLCLVGWGKFPDRGNQLWDQCAIGAWGESITYDPDMNLDRSMIDDVRPLMVYAMKKDRPVKWNWTNNVGGGNFFCCWDGEGELVYNEDVKTCYEKYCPVVTDVTYAGEGADGKVDFRCRTQIYRSEDIVRGVYTIRYDVKEDLKVSADAKGGGHRVAFFQLGADGYNNHSFEKMARGNAKGLIEQWAPVKGGLKYSRVAMPCEGDTPWFSLHEGNSRDKSKFGAWANRGLVIRQYKARLGGKQNDMPYASVYGTENGRVPSANVELSVPGDVTELKAGDYVEAKLVYVILPQYAKDYYGPNAGLKAALEANPDSWQLVHREAVGNDLDVKVHKGELICEYPVEIQAKGGIEFEVTGGLGYVPMTFMGLRDYRGYRFERFEGGKWNEIDQSVHGRDFWQSDYDSQAGQWSRSYSVSLDTPGEKRKTHKFRLVGPGL